MEDAKMHRCIDAKKPIQPFDRSTVQPFGFLNVYKPVGMTSHDVIGILRKITKIKQIGHAGTLDPFAQGVLPIAIGKATRLIEFLDDEKEYLAQISFGKSTDTYDCDGKAIFECNSKIALKDIQEALKKFEGEISQTPPIYSAIKVKGKKLYEYARKGEEVKIEPRKVFIEKIELKNFDETSQKAEVLIKCSKGTYIRSIAHDLGQDLKVGAHLSKLIRTQVGKFFIEDSIQLDSLCGAHGAPYGFEIIEKKLINPLNVINLPQIEINEEEHKKVLMGQTIDAKTQRGKEAKQNKNYASLHPCIFASEENHSPFLILVYNNNINAVAQVIGNQIQVKKVFL